jgi:hypothetical protein
MNCKCSYYFQQNCVKYPHISLNPLAVVLTWFYKAAWELQKFWFCVFKNQNHIKILWDGIFIHGNQAAKQKLEPPHVVSWNQAEKAGNLMLAWHNQGTKNWEPNVPGPNGQQKELSYILDNHAGIRCKVSTFNVCRSKFLPKVPTVQSSYKLKVPTFAKILWLKIPTFQIPISAKFLLLEVTFWIKAPTVSSFLRVQCSYLSKFFLLQSSFRIG